MAEVLCNRCGHRNSETANFCSSCGAPVSGRAEERTMAHEPAEVGDATEELSVALDDVPAGAGLLLVKRGPGAGSRFVIDSESTSAGRHPDSDIFLDDVTVSRRHAEIVRAGHGFAVRDVGSLNGTYLNRERIDAVQPLVNGDELQIGRFKLVFLTASTS